MLQLAFDPADVARTRFAISPLWETVASVRVLKAPAQHPLHRSWVARVRPVLDASGLDWSPLADLVPSPGSGPVVMPGFLAPPPPAPAPDLGAELAMLRRTDPGLVRDGVRNLGVPATPALTRLYDEPEAGLARLSDVVERYWELALSAYWPRMSTLLTGDVSHRARRLAEGGAQSLFDDLDPKVRWDTDTLYVTQPVRSRSEALRGRGLVLVPSVFVWPRVFSKVYEPWQPTLRYPPRGVGTVWEGTGAEAPDGLAGVLGRTRARLLAELETPRSTGDLARALGLSAGGVSQHLSALRAAALVTAHRSGRFVLYARTAAAEALLTANTP